MEPTIKETISDIQRMCRDLAEVGEMLGATSQYGREVWQLKSVSGGTVGVYMAGMAEQAKSDVLLHSGDIESALEYLEKIVTEAQPQPETVG